MPGSIAALRGATTVDTDDADGITARVQELVTSMLVENDLLKEDVISAIFTATDDITSMFPAAAARGIGFGDVPLLCARELAIADGMPRCIRILMHVETDRPRKELHHVYLHGAVGLRDDLN